MRRRATTSLAELRSALADYEPRSDRDRVGTGWSALDEATGGGFFAGALNEILVSQPGCGAGEALLPALSRLDPAGDRPRFWAWVHPHRMPYPPALVQAGLPLHRWLCVRPEGRRDHLWAVEVILRSGLCDALVTWLGEAPDRALRRLQLAAQEGGALALLFRPGAVGRLPSPASLRLEVLARPAASPRRRQLIVDVLKCRGRALVPSVQLEWSLDALDEPATSGPRNRTPAWEGRHEPGPLRTLGA